MRLKLFHAPSMAEAMARVRASLGAEALILSTRELAGGVEITAALEQDDTLPAPPPDPPPLPPLPPLPVPPAAPASVTQAFAPAAWAAPGSLSSASRAAPPPGGSSASAARIALLGFHGVPQGLHPVLLHGGLPEALPRAIGFAALPFDRPLLLAGPPGAGKTLTIARLATRLTLAGLRPMVITADDQRAGATEQLAAFTRLLGIDLIVADTPTLIERTLRRRRDGVPVLIDCFGIDPLDAAAARALSALVDAAGARPVAVLPAGIDAAEAADAAAALHALGASYLVATRLDLARRLGSVLAAAATGLALAEVGIGPGAADGLVPATPARLAERLAGAAPRAHPAPAYPQAGHPAHGHSADGHSAHGHPAQGHPARRQPTQDNPGYAALRHPQPGEGQKS